MNSWTPCVCFSRWNEICLYITGFSFLLVTLEPGPFSSFCFSILMHNNQPIVIRALVWICAHVVAVYWLFVSRLVSYRLSGCQLLSYLWRNLPWWLFLLWKIYYHVVFHLEQSFWAHRFFHFHRQIEFHALQEKTEPYNKGADRSAPSALYLWTNEYPCDPPISLMP